MNNGFVRAIKVMSVAGILAAGGAANAQAWDPIAFGPLGNLPSGASYWTSVIDISGDGMSYVGATNLGQGVLVTPSTNYLLTIPSGSSPFGMSRNGQVVVGGTTTTPQHWSIVNAAGSTIPAVNIPLPSGVSGVGPVYGTNANGTAFGLPSPTAAMTASYHRRATTSFLAINPAGTAGAYRGIAADVPVMIVLGTFPGNPTNAYRWNFDNNTVSALNMPAGASSIEAGAVGASMSGDASRVGGTATIGGITQPYWWDAAGNPHAVPLLPGAIFGQLTAMNYAGTLGGGSMWISGQGNRAMLHSLNGGEVFNLHTIYSQAGLLPAGWTLVSTRHISDDGSRIYCLATAPDGTNRMVLLTGNHLPTPGSLALLGLGGLVAMRRRR